MTQRYEVRIARPGPRPAFYCVAEHLWGKECDVDSDGNSESPDDTNWTELDLHLRGSGLYVDVLPLSFEPLVLVVGSSDEALCWKAARFLALHSGGELQGAA
jgi:hypothetical protein